MENIEKSITDVILRDVEDAIKELEALSPVLPILV